MALTTDENTQSPLHVYTEWLGNELQPINLNVIPNRKLEQDFPLLEKLIADLDDDCLLNYARMTIVLPDSTIAYSSKTLDIRNEYICGGGTLGQHEYFVQTQFFEAEGMFSDEARLCTVDPHADVLTVPFSSNTWMTILYNHQEALKNTVNCLDRPTNMVEIGQRGHLFNERNRISAELSEMTVLQKISCRKTIAHGY